AVDHIKGRTSAEGVVIVRRTAGEGNSVRGAAGRLDCSVKTQVSRPGRCVAGNSQRVVQAQDGIASHLELTVGVGYAHRRAGKIEGARVAGRDLFEVHAATITQRD